MVFNGLTNSDLTVYNALLEFEEGEPVSAAQIADLICCHTNTVYQALSRLVNYKMIERHRPGAGVPYRYRIREDD